MTVRDYLETNLKTCSRYELTEVDKQFIKEYSLREFLFKQITRKKFRKWKLPDPARARIKEALDFCLPAQSPIIFRFRFGGYKLWRFTSAPTVDWAEFFVIVHFCNYLAPIIAAYEPGIKLLFASDDVFVERLNNIPKKDTDAYYNSFQELLDQFRKYFPENFEVDMIRHSSLYQSEDEFEAEFAAELEKVKGEWKSRRDPEQLKKSLATSRMNVKWDGVENLTNLSDEQKQKRIERGVVYHDALVQMPIISEWSDKKDKIPIFTTSFPKVVAIGSTRNSIVRFWVGTGVLEKRGESYADRIVSIQQYEAIRDLPREEVEMDLVPLKNFVTIKVYNQSFDFANK